MTNVDGSVVGAFDEMGIEPPPAVVPIDIAVSLAPATEGANVAAVTVSIGSKIM